LIFKGRKARGTIYLSTQEIAPERGNVMKRKLSLTGILMTAGVLLTFIVIVGVGSLATAAKLPADLTVNQFIAAVEQAPPEVRLAQSAPSAGKMLGGAGLFGPSDIVTAPGGAGGILFFYLDREGNLLTPPPAPVDDNPYWRCPMGGFDC
jgi:hypothetical protein